MPIAKVTHIDQSKNGKDRVYLDGKNNWQDAYYVKQGLRMPAIGMTIDADTSSQTFQGARHATWFLNDWKDTNPATAVGAAQRAAAPTPPPIQGNGRSAPIEAPSGWDVQSGDLSRFVSNVVGSAIAAGLIKEPKEVMNWAKFGYKAAELLKSGFQEDGPDPSTHAGDPDFDDQEIPF